MKLRDFIKKGKPRTEGTPVDINGVVPVVGDTIYARVRNPWGDGGKYTIETLYVCEVFSDPPYIEALFEHHVSHRRNDRERFYDGGFAIAARTRAVRKGMMEDMIDRANHGHWIPYELSDKAYDGLERWLKHEEKKRKKYEAEMKAKDPNWVDYYD